MHRCWGLAPAIATFVLTVAFSCRVLAAGSGSNTANTAPPPSAPDSNATVLEDVVVTAARAPQSPERVSSSAYVYAREALEASPAMSLDTVLRAVPSFNLFRRADSMVANPTTQGVSLRGLGPSGASRSMVLLDGIPLNDPFGGWIAWSQIPIESLARVEVLPGGGASAWGNSALSGVMQLLSNSFPGATRNTGRFSITAGDFATHRESFAATAPLRESALQLSGEDFVTDGYRVVAAERRGPIDVPAWSRHRTLVARWRAPIGTRTSLTTSVRSFEESRGNGTPYQRNGSREKFAGIDLTSQSTDTFSWVARAYAQTQSYASTFSAVNAARTGETPASDQFAVPAIAIGGSWVGTWSQSNGTQTSAGVDLRTVRGETRENYSFASGAYTRQRFAGGTQSTAGAFAVREQSLAPTLRLTIGARGDANSDTDGHRREADRTNGAVTRDDLYPSQRTFQFNPSAGVVWTPSRLWRVRANVQQAFRRPTLNELYRPFRQGANVTEANAGLRTERAQSAELGVEWEFGEVPSPAVRRRGGRDEMAATLSRPRFSVQATVFHNELRDAVANVTIARGPGSFPLFGTLPAGGVGRQRLNLDRIRVNGLESVATWRPTGPVELSAAYLYNDATVERAAVAPGLIGKRLAEVPRHNASLGAVLRASQNITFNVRLRWTGKQFDDDENTLRLGEVAVLDVGATKALSARIELFINVENVGDARIETARSSDGVVNTGTPRFAFGGLRAKW